jgi:hypothetical protein
MNSNTAVPAHADLDDLLGTDTVKQEWECVADSGTVRELNVIARPDGVDFVGTSSNETAQKISSNS